MPLKLGESIAGGAASALGGSGKAGPTSTKNVTGGTAGTSTGSSATNYTEAPGILNFQESLLPAVSNLYQQAQQPVYGTAQEAQILNGADQATQAGQQALTGALARNGALTSGAAAAGDTALQAANTGSLTNFLTQVPYLNQQAELSNETNALNTAESIVGRAPVSTNASGGSSTFGTNSNTTTESGPAFGAAMANSLGNGLTNASGGGKGGGKGSSNGYNGQGGIGGGSSLDIPGSIVSDF